MSAVVTSDSYDLSSVEMRGTSILAITRVLYIDGLTAADWPSAIIEALETPGVPQFWDLHPSISSLRLVNIRPVAIAPNQVRLEAHYAYDGLMLLDFNSVLESRATDKDSTGQRVTVFCEGTAARPIAERDKIQSALMNRLYPVTTFSLSQIWPSPGSDYALHPAHYASDLIGKVNSIAWAFENDTADPFPPRTVLCTGLSLVYEGYGKFSYKRIMHFMVRPETWDARAEFIDNETGAPHVGIVEGQGAKTVVMYPEIDFNSYIGLMPN